MTHDYLGGLGALALASRIRRLLYHLQADGTRVYLDLGLEFKPKWFPVFRLVAERSNATTMELAHALDMAHPSVIAIVEELVERGWVASCQGKEDRRRRELDLTPEGWRAHAELEPVWRAFAEAGHEVTHESGNDFLAALAALEAAIERRSMYERIMERLP